MRRERIAVVGLGYVGFPLMMALAEQRADVIGFDVDNRRIDALKCKVDWTGEVPAERLKRVDLQFTNHIRRADGCTFFIVTVPTPIDEQRRPDLAALCTACDAVGRALHPGSVVVFESTVYPGVTEEVCGPVLERASGLTRGRDFTLGYSPERANPGDRERTLDKIVKVIAAEDAPTLARVAAVYSSIIKAGLHRAPSIRVAEAAKVIENTQRDLNIALMNELAIIFGRLGIRTKDVLDAAGTKWNFLNFSPGLVGGHCIGVDPYYLTAKAQAVGYHPEVILAGRRINDSMGRYVAQSLIRLLVKADVSLKQARIGILGLTFKEDVPDLRNSRVPDIIAELREYGAELMVHDPIAAPDRARDEYDIRLSDLDDFTDLHAIVLAVPHRAYLAEGFDVVARIRPGGIVMDIKSVLTPERLANHGICYWSL